MLIYEKKIKEPLTILTVLEGDSTTPSRIILRDFTDISRTIPSNIYQAVLKDNQNFLFEKNIFSLDFFEFFYEIMKNGKQFFNISDVCIEYTLDLVAHAYHNKTMPSLVKILHECFLIYPGSENNFLELLMKDNMEILVNYLLICPDKISRESFASLLSISLSLSAEKNFTERSIARVIVDNLLSLIPNELTKQAIRFENY